MSFPTDCLGVCIEYLSLSTDLFNLMLVSKRFFEFIFTDTNPHATYHIQFYYGKRKKIFKKKQQMEEPMGEKSKKSLSRWLGNLIRPKIVVGVKPTRTVYLYVKRLEVDRKCDEINFMESFPNAIFVDMQLNYMMPKSGFNGLGKVKYLNLYWCQTLRDDSFKFMESMEVLDISGCKKLTSKAIENIHDHCPNLKLINICNAGKKNANYRMGEGNRKLYSIGAKCLTKLKEKGVKVYYRKLFEEQGMYLLPMYASMVENKREGKTRRKVFTFEEQMERNFKHLMEKALTEEIAGDGDDLLSEESDADDNR